LDREFSWEGDRTKVRSVYIQRVFFVQLYKRGKKVVLVVEMDDVAGLQEAAGTRFSQFELIGRGSFGDVYKA
jgi:hypothetical protein